jgi:hypothetical protein
MEYKHGALTLVLRIAIADRVMAREVRDDG